jgi:hypothetical protein
LPDAAFDEPVHIISYHFFSLSPVMFSSAFLNFMLLFRFFFLSQGRKGRKQTRDLRFAGFSLNEHYGMQMWYLQIN